MNKKFIFLVPCFNCGKFIFNNSKKLIKEIKKNKINYELLFLNDGSSDNTLNELKRVKSLNKKIKIISYKKNLGKSSILKIAIKNLSNCIVVFYDCDLPYFEYLTKLILMLKSGKKFVTIDRRSRKSKFDNNQQNIYQISRYVISKLVNIIISYLLMKNYKGDTQSGLKGFQVDNKLKKQNFVSTKFFLDAEIISYYTKNNVHITSIPINYKISKQSSIKIFDFNNIIYLLELIKIIFNRFSKF